jgi:hypothetical protein
MSEVHLHLQRPEILRGICLCLASHLLPRPLLKTIKLLVDVHDVRIYRVVLCLVPNGQESKSGFTRGIPPVRSESLDSDCSNSCFKAKVIDLELCAKESATICCSGDARLANRCRCGKTSSENKGPFGSVWSDYVFYQCRQRAEIVYSSKNMVESTMNVAEIGMYARFIRSCQSPPRLRKGCLKSAAR